MRRCDNEECVCIEKKKNDNVDDDDDGDDPEEKRKYWPLPVDENDDDLMMMCVLIRQNYKSIKTNHKQNCGHAKPEANSNFDVIQGNTHDDDEKDAF